MPGERLLSADRASRDAAADRTAGRVDVLHRGRSPPASRPAATNTPMAAAATWSFTTNQNLKVSSTWPGADATGICAARGGARHGLASGRRRRVPRKRVHAARTRTTRSCRRHVTYDATDRTATLIPHGDARPGRDVHGDGRRQRPRGRRRAARHAVVELHDRGHAAARAGPDRDLPGRRRRRRLARRRPFGRASTSRSTRRPSTGHNVTLTPDGGAPVAATVTYDGGEPQGHPRAGRGPVPEHALHRDA